MKKIIVILISAMIITSIAPFSLHADSADETRLTNAIIMGGAAAAAIGLLVWARGATAKTDEQKAVEKAEKEKKLAEEIAKKEEETKNKQQPVIDALDALKGREKEDVIMEIGVPGSNYKEDNIDIYVYVPDDKSVLYKFVKDINDNLTVEKLILFYKDNKLDKYKIQFKED